MASRFHSGHYKRGLIALSLCLAMGSFFPAAAQSVNDQLLEKSVGEYEQHVFATSFEGQPIAERLSRLETVIFGAPQAGISAVREQHLSQVLKPLIKEAAKNAATHHPATAADNTTTAPSTAMPAPQDYYKEPDATSYPTVTALEREIIGRDFIHDDIARRLDRLEQRVFNQSYPQVDLVDRVDKLLARYPQARAQSGAYTPDYPPSALDGLPSNSGAFVGSGRDTYTKLELLEQRLLGHTLSGKLITERLDVLEDRAFATTYSGQSVDTRLNRLMKGANSNFAGPPPTQPRQTYTRPYEQGAAPQTTITQSTTSYGSYGGVPYERQQNIQIGAGIASNSQYSYSPEMVQMLPPDLQRQYYSQQAQQQQQSYYNTPGGYNVYSTGPGSVVMREQTSGPFGATTTTTRSFETFGNTGANVQYQNYYSGPGLPQNNGQVNGPVYVGNPAVLSALNDLEIKIFTAVNTTDTVPIRLSKLETQLIGQTYMGYPDEERINNLAKVYQYQSLSKVLGGGKAGNVIKGVGGAMLGIPLTAPGTTTTTTPATTTP